VIEFAIGADVTAAAAVAKQTEGCQKGCVSAFL
jgi:hypothetical protein